ncbi:potassium channel family protein [Streptomyces sp. NRRL S-340]|uniref:potassium channel family protein n=1 Tax=Streptomyces sp. NRRL S-340 TaxID=1463901 RepID=UPI0005619ACF|nr:potassium channel family protein [Streptomyces sp. NRRL S-340]
MDGDGPVTRRERRVDAPLAVASPYAVLVPGKSLPRAPADGCRAVPAASWAVFAVGHGVHRRLSSQGVRFVRRRRPDTLAVPLPLLRPVRILRVYDAVRRRRGRTRCPLQARVMLYAGLSALLPGLAGSLTVYGPEHRAPRATIRTFGESVWGTCSTPAAVGHGDVTPVTSAGRLVAVVLMGCGPALPGAATGAFSSGPTQRPAQPGEERRPPGS